MSYTALYRKFRPQEFCDVRGQEHIVTTLKNQIRASRIGHAYLFCGTRGTGKTTVAKIFARAVNCENPADGDPCGQCSVCQGIAAGTSMNVIEIDAASNNGVDNIRQIREEVAYRPTEGKYRVYIIDEVHMLSAGAFNALLKTLEEPPSYVIFILATTEAHRIPITILSRCQRYDFRRISIDTIAQRLTELAKKENVEAEEQALRYVAKAGDGSMRDALSLLDQCIAFHLGEKLTYDNVLDVLGAVDTEVFSRLLRQIMEKDAAGAVRTVDALVDEGREPGQFVNDFTWYMRNLLLIQSCGDMEEALGVSAENLALLKEEAGMIKPEVLMRYIRVFSELGSEVKYAAQKRIVMEIAVIKLCKPQMERDYGSLADRLDSLERRLESGAFAQASLAPDTPKAADTREEKPALPAAVPEDIKKIIKGWRVMLSEAGGIARQYLNRAVPSLGANGELLLVFDDPAAFGYLDENRANSMSGFRDMIARRIGKEPEIVLRMNESARTAKESVPDLRELIHFEIEEENF